MTGIKLRIDMIYTAKIEKDGDGYSAYFPDVPGADTCGDTKEEAVKFAGEALNGVLASMLGRKDPLPQANALPDKRKGLYPIEVKPQLAIAYSIFEARRGKPAAEISRRMGIARQAYRRLEDPGASLSVATLLKFSRAVGKRLEIRFV